MSPYSHKANQATHSKMSKSDVVDGKVSGKRQRRPSVRLGGYVSSDSNRKVVVVVNNTQKKKNKEEEEEIAIEGKAKKNKKNRVRVRLNVDDKNGNDDDFAAAAAVSDSDSPRSHSENLQFQIHKSKTTKRIRTDHRVSVDEKDDDDAVQFRVSDSDREITPADDENADMNGVKVWLDELGLGKYAPLFHVHEVDEDVLPLLTLEDLKDMGIHAVGSRRKIFAYIHKLREED